MNIGKTFSDVLRFVDLSLSFFYFQSNIIIMNFGRPIFDHQIDRMIIVKEEKHRKNFLK
mgnify:CR=1 FL=1